MDNAPAIQPSPPDGELYLTVSTLIKRQKLKKHKGLYEAFTAIRDDENNRRTIERAVQPMFNDISDRERHIFFDEHLIDANTSPTSENFRQADLSSSITLEIPRTIKWLTEGQRWQFDAGARWELTGVTCRYFWFMHSNMDVSYHISLQIPYKHDARHYYALSLLQKTFYPSERPDGGSFEESFCINVVDPEKPTHAGQRESLADFLQRKFGAHVDNILPGQNQAWLEKLAHKKSAKIERAFFCPAFSRAAFLLKDDLFDRTLRQPKKAIDELALRSTGTTPDSSADDSIDSQQKPLSDVYRDVAVEELSDEGLALIFLSGFLQNIIDFLEQDKLEYSDAIEPLYPQGGLNNDEHFLLYATEHSIFEIVASSRSLDKGSKYIGTCPYLFLVHVTVFHDESLVQRFATSVRKLIEKIGEKTNKFSDFNSVSIDRLDKIVATFHKGRFGIFGEVERYLHINTFLYSTEQSFYKAISDYRYVEGRLDHWDRLLNELSSATNGAHELARQKTERRINRILFYIASFSVFQVLFAISQSIGRWKFQDIDYEFSASVLDACFIAAALSLAAWALTRRNLYRWRRNK